MVKTELSESLVEAGERLIRQLDEKQLSPTSAYWFLMDAGIWRLVLAHASVGEKGPRQFYEKIQEILNFDRETFGGLTLEDITVVPPSDRIVSVIRRALATGRGISGIRFSQNIIDGILIEDAYIYRSN